MADRFTAAIQAAAPHCPACRTQFRARLVVTAVTAEAIAGTCPDCHGRFAWPLTDRPIPRHRFVPLNRKAA